MNGRLKHFCGVLNCTENTSVIWTPFQNIPGVYLATSCDIGVVILARWWLTNAVISRRFMWVILATHQIESIATCNLAMGVDVTCIFRADSKLVPSHWEMSLQSNALSHWLGSNLDSAPILPQCGLHKVLDKLHMLFPFALCLMQTYE